jgi:hypothetical protein
MGYGHGIWSFKNFKLYAVIVWYLRYLILLWRFLGVILQEDQYVLELCRNIIDFYIVFPSFRLLRAYLHFLTLAWYYSFRLLSFSPMVLFLYYYYYYYYYRHISILNNFSKCLNLLYMTVFLITLNLNEIPVSKVSQSTNPPPFGDILILSSP